MVSSIIYADQSTAAPPKRWSLADIDFDGIERCAVADDALAFRVVLLASFIETGSDLYANNLIEYFAGDTELSDWLRQSWQPEEVQHGNALHEYALRVWPDVDWDGKYDEFFPAYARTCTLEPAKALELAARCIVETGTSTLYSTLHDYAREPVLKDLAGRIFADEVLSTPTRDPAMRQAVAPKGPTVRSPVLQRMPCGPTEESDRRRLPAEGVSATLASRWGRSMARYGMRPQTPITHRI